jgi:hypothetical protein
LATHSSAQEGPVGAAHPVIRFLIAVAAVLITSAVAAAEISRDEALALAFPGAGIRAERLFLTAAQQKRAAEESGVDVPSPLIARYVATRDGEIVGRAYVDTSTVRTKKETLLISLDPAGRVRRVDVTAFLEPREYEAPEAWLRQYRERALTRDLEVNRGIRPIAGATLTARAVNEAVRRVMAIDHALQAGAGK